MNLNMKTKITKIHLFLLDLTFDGVRNVLVFFGLLNPRSKKIEHLKPERESRETIMQYLKNFATSSNSIYHMYGSMHHFIARLRSIGGNSQTALIGYTSKFEVSIMLTDPLCEPQLREDAIRSFTKHCAERGDDPLMLAIDKTTAEVASKQGYRLLKIGQEPIFDLTTYDPEKLSSKLKSSIRQAAKKGLIIEQVHYADLFKPTLSSPLNEILNKWFITRGTDRMKMLTEVAPVKAAREKKFFIARTDHSIEGFLVCSPIFHRRGFFLHDLIRAPFSMNGVTDALVLFALTQLKAEGYAMASLGVSPLAGLERLAPGKGDFSRLNNLLLWVFNNLRANYRFKELYHFKKKFMPTHEEPVYLAVGKGRLKLRHVLAVIGVFSTLNPITQISFKFRKWRQGYDVPQPLKWAFQSDRVTLPPLSAYDIETVFWRTKVTLTMMFLNLFAFIYTTDISGKIDGDVLAQHGFSFEHFGDHQWFILVTSNFVHFNYTHLLVNLVGMFLFCGALELAVGSNLAFLVYAIGLQSNIPTGLMLLPTLNLMVPSLLQNTVSSLDVGASLGVMSGFGGLCYLLKKKVRTYAMTLAVLILSVYAVATSDLIGFDHIVAIYFGYFMTRYYCLSQPSQKMFDIKETSYFEKRKKRRTA